MRLIDADALIEFCAERWIPLNIDAVNMQPTIQPEPHEGHWIEGGIYRDVIECNCSECGQLMTTAATVRMNFCPNCGAKMKGEANE